MALALVRFTYPVSELFLVFLDDLHAAVGAAAVDDDVLQVGVVLQQDRADGLFQVLHLVVGGGDDADLGPGGTVRHALEEGVSSSSGQVINSFGGFLKDDG